MEPCNVYAVYYDVSKTACIKWNHVTFILGEGSKAACLKIEIEPFNIYTVYCVKVPKQLAWNGIMKHYKYCITKVPKWQDTGENPSDLAWSECLAHSLVSLSFQLNYITALCWFLIVCSFPQVLLLPKTEVQPFAVDQNLKSGLDSLLVREGGFSFEFKGFLHLTGNEDVCKCD